VAVTTFGGTDEREIAVRVALPADADQTESGEAGRDLAKQVVDALEGQDVLQRKAEGLLDLNVTDQVTLSRSLVGNAGLSQEEADDAAEALTSFRRENSGVFTSLDQALGLEGLSEAAREYLGQNAFTGPFGLRGQEVIAGAVSAEMRTKALFAIVGALVFMLIYIWVRFQLQYGIAAIMALVHDTIITLGAFAIAGMEANLPVVAAFLTLVGYSVNDTIVVFDRVRENLKTRGTGKLAEVINMSINQNLSRTLITSMTTWFVVACMFFLGGPVIRPFAFVLLIGVLVGTYSSIYIASPVLLFWNGIFAKGAAKGAAKRAAQKASANG
jgi:preprotein translocase subunit SecF